MKSPKQSKYDASPDDIKGNCDNCFYFSEGICTKNQEELVAISDPTIEYCGDFSLDYTENTANMKRSV